MSKQATNRTTQEKEKINQRFQVIAWAQWNWSVQEQIESFSDSLGGTRDHVEERNQVKFKSDSRWKHYSNIASSHYNVETLSTRKSHLWKTMLKISHFRSQQTVAERH